MPFLLSGGKLFPKLCCHILSLQLGHNLCPQWLCVLIFARIYVISCYCLQRESVDLYNEKAVMRRLVTGRWRIRRGSNPQPLPSEGSTLSIELRMLIRKNDILPHGRSPLQSNRIQGQLFRQGRILGEISLDAVHDGIGNGFLMGC